MLCCLNIHIVILSIDRYICVVVVVFKRLLSPYLCLHLLYNLRQIYMPKIVNIGYNEFLKKSRRIKGYLRSHWCNTYMLFLDVIHVCYKICVFRVFLNKLLATYSVKYAPIFVIVQSQMCLRKWILFKLNKIVVCTILAVS